MTAKDTWNALREPIEKNCLNCIYNLRNITGSYCTKDDPNGNLTHPRCHGMVLDWEWDGNK